MRSGIEPCLSAHHGVVESLLLIEIGDALLIAFQLFGIEVFRLRAEFFAKRMVEEFRETARGGLRLDEVFEDIGREGRVAGKIDLPDLGGLLFRRGRLRKRSGGQEGDRQEREDQERVVPVLSIAGPDGQYSFSSSKKKSPSVG